MTDLNTIIDDNKKDFAVDTLKQILKGWGAGFAKLPDNEKLDAIKEILKMAGVDLANSPAGGLAIKIAEGRRRDTDTQERIRYAQSFNLAVALLGASLKEFCDIKGVSLTSDLTIQKELEKWQKYFYQKLNQGDQTND